MSTILRQANERLPAATKLILLGEYGSRAHDVAIDSSDLDYIGIAIEPIQVTLGLDNYEHTVLKANGPGVASLANEEEGTIYALKKFARLAEAGNTAIVSALYLPKYEVLTEAGAVLVASRELFISRSILKRFAGHLTTERRRMNGDLRVKVLRPKLVEEFGFDSKAAYQALKLAFHGRRFAESGTMQIPFESEERDFILAVRRGEVPPAEIDELLEEIVSYLDRESEASSILPEAADRGAINSMLRELYEDAYLK